MKEALLAAAAVGACSFALTSFLVRRENLIAIHDIPNPRSSHSTPRSRAGGIALFLSLALGLVAARALGLSAPFVQGNVSWILLGAVGFFSLGLLDDVLHLPEMTRLCVQMILSVTVAMLGVRLEVLELPGLGVWVLPYWLSVGLTVFWYAGFTNLFNFMDGIDGYAAGEAAMAGVFLSLAAGSPWPLLISAAALGFLAYNWAPSRIFMGDGGSYLLGYLLAVACVTACVGSGRRMPFLAVVIFIATFAVDAAATLCWRIVRGEPWMKAHRSHYYQKLTDRGFGHGQVSSMNLAVTALLGLSGFIYADVPPAGQWAILGVWFAFFGLLFLWIDAKRQGAAAGREGHGG